MSKHDALRNHTSITQKNSTYNYIPSMMHWPGPKSKAASLGRRFNLVSISEALDPQENITIAPEESEMTTWRGWLAFWQCGFVSRLVRL